MYLKIQNLAWGLSDENTVFAIGASKINIHDELNQYTNT